MEVRPRTEISLISSDLAPTLCVETWAGCASLIQEWVRLGFTGKAYECKPDGQYLPEGDVTRPEVQKELQEDVVQGSVYHAHIAVTCTTWGTLRGLGENPGDKNLR